MLLCLPGLACYSSFFPVVLMSRKHHNQDDSRFNDFLTAMSQSHVPKQVIIPMAVLLRYMPTLKEDWGYIKDAMILRGVTPSLTGFIKSPVTTVECLYVPLLITASKTADDPSIAAVTRGIENPDFKKQYSESCTLESTIIPRCWLFVAMTVCTIYLGGKGKMINLRNVSFEYAGNAAVAITKYKYRHSRWRVRSAMWAFRVWQDYDPSPD